MINSKTGLKVTLMSTLVLLGSVVTTARADHDSHSVLPYIAVGVIASVLHSNYHSHTYTHKRRYRHTGHGHGHGHGYGHGHGHGSHYGHGGHGGHKKRSTSHGGYASSNKSQKRH